MKKHFLARVSIGISKNMDDSLESLRGKSERRKALFCVSICLAGLD
jgi:hypothetical protein